MLAEAGCLRRQVFVICLELLNLAGVCGVCCRSAPGPLVKDGAGAWSNLMQFDAIHQLFIV